MNEKNLFFLAIISLFIGFFSLLALFFFQKPIDASFKQDLPQNDLISFKAKVIDVYNSSHGQIIELERPIRLKGYFQGDISQINFTYVFLTARFDGEFLEINSIRPTNEGDVVTRK